VTSVTLALLGWNANGAHAAARNTARFSALCFIVAFATPGLARWFQGIPQTGLTLSFVAAHLVHYAVVAVLLATFERARLVHDFIRLAPIALAGFALVVALGFTASHRSSRLYMFAHIVSLYIVFIIFCLAFVLNRGWPLRFVAFLLGSALILRLTGQRAARLSLPLQTSASR